MCVAPRKSPSGNICGKHVRKSRDAKKWSQALLATKCQLAGWDATREMIANIEGLRRILTDYELKILIIVLEADVREWLK